MITEQWKTIDNFDIYEVSNTGKVRNKKSKKILKQAKQSAGYSIVCLCYNGVRSTKTIHRLVMNAFYPNPDEKKYTDINHKDHDKSNNSIENLEWCTHGYNMKWNYLNKNETTIELFKQKLMKEFSDWLDKNIISNVAPI